MAFSDLLQSIGDFGKFQIIQSTLIVLVNVLIPAHMLLENFSAAIPAHRCYINLLDNATTFGTNLTKNLTTEDLLRVSIPMGMDQKPEQCRRFTETQWQLLNPNVSATNTTELDTEPCLDGWVYDQSIFYSTIVTKWNLVCDSKSFRSLSQSIFMTGSMLGTPISGYLADRFGRKPLLLCFSLVAVLMGTSSAFVPIFSVYCALRLILSFSLGTIYNNSLILLIEWSPTQSQPVILTAIALSLSTGQVLLAGLSYIFRDWRTLQLSVSLPYLVFFMYLWWVSESARWLIIEGKLEKSLKELKRVAHFNGRKDAADHLNVEVLRSTMKRELDSLNNRTKIKEVFGNPTMRRIMFCLLFMRFSSFFFFYGLMLDLRTVGSNIFLTQALLGAVDFPVKYLTLFAMKYMNRRSTIASVLFLAGSSVLVNIFIPQDMPNLRLGIAMIGKGIMAVYFSMGETYNHELIPTGTRSTLQGIITFVGRLGATLGTLLLITKDYFQHLPGILFGVFPILASTCICFLPETLNCSLPDTVEDVEKRNKYYMDSAIKKQPKNILLKSTEC